MHEKFDRSRLNIKPLASRQSKSDTGIMIDRETPLPPIATKEAQFIEQLTEKMKASKKKGAPIIMAYGAHLFKNGLAPLIIELMEAGYLQQLLTNGAGSIHDWEMAFQGENRRRRPPVPRGRPIRYLAGNRIFYQSRSHFGCLSRTGIRGCCRGK